LRARTRSGVGEQVREHWDDFQRRWLKIVVAGERALLFANGATQPALIGNDLKQPRAAGTIALWMGRGRSRILPV
jgi:hypothetical protein